MIAAPSPAPAVFPLPDHRTMEQVLRDESNGCVCELVEIHGDVDGCQWMAKVAADDAIENAA